MIELTLAHNKEKVYIAWDCISVIAKAKEYTDVVVNYGEDNCYRVTESAKHIIDLREYYMNEERKSK